MTDKKNEKKTLGDYIEVALPAFGPDVNARIFRESTKDDEQWQTIKAAAQQAGIVRTLKEGSAPTSTGKMPAAEADTIDAKDPMTGATVRIPRGNIPAERWKQYQARAAKGEQPADFGQQRDVLEMQGQTEPPTVTPKTVLDEKNQPAGGGIGSMVRKTLGSMLGGALPGGVPDAGAPAPQQLPASDGGVLPQMGAPDAGAPAPAALPGGVPAPAVPAPDAGLSSPPTEPGTAPDMGFSPAKPLTNPVDMAVANGLTPGAGTAPMSGVPNANFSGPNGPQSVPAPAPQPGMQGMKTDVMQKTVTPGAQGSGLEADLNRGYADAMRAKKDIAQEDAKNQTAIAEAEVVKQKALLATDDARAARAKAVVERQDKVLTAMTEATASLGEQLKVDPNRLWASRTAQQKADAKLAGFLFGLAGTGAQYVQSLQQEVDRDVQAQIQVFEANQRGKQAQVSSLNNIYTQLRQQGLDAAEAAKATKATLLEVHGSKLEELKARFQGNTAGARAAEAAAALSVDRVKSLDALKNSASERAARSASIELQRQQLDLKSQQDLLKAAKGEKLDATIEGQLMKDIDNIIMLQQMEQEAGAIKLGGGPFGAFEGATRNIYPRGMFDEYKAKTDAYELKRSGLASAIAKGAVGAEESARIMPNIAGAFDVTRDPVEGTKQAREYYTRAYLTKLDALESRGIDVSGLRKAIQQRGIKSFKKE